MLEVCSPDVSVGRSIKIRDKFRRQVAEARAARTSVTLGYVLDEWLAGGQVEGTTRPSYRVAVEKCIKPAVEHCHAWGAMGVTSGACRTHAGM